MPGAAEILRDDASKLGDRAAEAGVPVSVEIYDGMGHLFQADARLQRSEGLAGAAGPVHPHADRDDRQA